LPPPNAAANIETIDAGPSSFQPMNVNFGLFPPMPEPVAFDRDGRKFGRGSAKNLARKSALSQRALNDLDRWAAAPAAAPVAAE
jgi:methylenetetrahydrofolate--tRNA-(uracil-5-)-methyltransferase